MNRSNAFYAVCVVLVLFALTHTGNEKAFHS